jgi:hypothetical protein
LVLDWCRAWDILLAYQPVGIESIGIGIFFVQPSPVSHPNVTSS